MFASKPAFHASGSRRSCSKTRHPPPRATSSARLWLATIQLTIANMSDSEVSVSIPSDKVIQNALRTVIARLFKTHHDTLTLKLARKAAEDEIDLPENFFKSNDKWNSRSKAFITEEVVRRINSSVSIGFLSTEELILFIAGETRPGS